MASPCRLSIEGVALVRERAAFGGAALGGGATVGSDALVGINAAVRPGVRVGDAATLGAGAVAASDVPDGVIATGIPASSDGSPAPAPQERG